MLSQGLAISPAGPYNAAQRRLAATETIVNDLYNTTARLVRYQDIACAAYNAGFTSEAKRKEALDFVSRAYDTARGIFGRQLQAEFPWDEAARSWPQAYLALSDVAPFGLHQWRPKHAQALAAYPDFVAKVESLAALREGIKGQTLVAKQPRPKTAQQLAKEAHEMTCQICGRRIFAETGVIAHHGYERPGDGYQTRSCEGAREQPFEVTMGALVDHIETVAAQIASHAAMIERIHTEAQPVPYSWTTKEVRHTGRRGREYVKKLAFVNRDNFDTVMADVQATSRYHVGGLTWDRVKHDHIRELQAAERALREYHAQQTKRAEAWTPTHRAGGAGEKTWVAL